MGSRASAAIKAIAAVSRERGRRAPAGRRQAAAPDTDVTGVSNHHAFLEDEAR